MTTSKDITAFINANKEEMINKGYTFVTDLKELEECGKRFGTTFSVGDVIEFMETPEEMHACYLQTGEKADGKPILTYSILVKVNGHFKFVAIGSFRREPIDYTEILKEYPFNIQAIEQPTHGACTKFLAGKTVKVVKQEKLLYYMFRSVDKIARPTPMFELQ